MRKEGCIRIAVALSLIVISGVVPVRADQQQTDPLNLPAIENTFEQGLAAIPFVSRFYVWSDVSPEHRGELLAYDRDTPGFYAGVPEADLIDRLLHRAQVEGRADDTREAITERMREYHHLTEAVLRHYRKQGVPVEAIDGTGSPDEVFERIRRAVGISSR